MIHPVMERIKMIQTFRCPVPGTSYFVDVPAETKKEAVKKACEVFRAQINKRYGS